MVEEQNGWAGRQPQKNVLLATGYDFIISEDKDAYKRNHWNKRNKIAFTILSKATQDGAAGWRKKQTKILGPRGADKSRILAFS